MIIENDQKPRIKENISITSQAINRSSDCTIILIMQLTSQATSSASMSAKAKAMIILGKGRNHKKQ